MLKYVNIFGGFAMEFLKKFAWNFRRRFFCKKYKLGKIKHPQKYWPNDIGAPIWVLAQGAEGSGSGSAREILQEKSRNTIWKKILNEVSPKSRKKNCWKSISENNYVETMMNAGKFLKGTPKGILRRNLPTTPLKPPYKIPAGTPTETPWKNLPTSHSGRNLRNNYQTSQK